MTVTPYEMAKIYWSRQKAYSIISVQKLIEGFSRTSLGKPYWEEVLHYLTVKQVGKKGLQ